MALKTYKDNVGILYTVDAINEADIGRHCDAYLAYIALSTNTYFHPSERDALYAEMLEATQTGEAIIVKQAGIEACYMYATHPAMRHMTVVAMYTPQPNISYIAKILAILYLYDIGLTLRYKPKDVYTLPQNALLNPSSLRALQQNITETVKFGPPILDEGIIQYLGLAKV